MNRKKELWVATPHVFSNHARTLSWRSILLARGERMLLTRRRNRWLRRKAAVA